MRKIIIEKMGRVPSPRYPTPPWADYEEGEVNPNVSLPLGYSIEGVLMSDMLVGHPLRVLRTHRNGVAKLGVFTTSPLIRVSPCTFETTNSVYTYRFVAED